MLKLARAADKRGVRTLGVITKPDTLIPNSESEAMYISLARNQDVEFRLGWHVLKNMDTEIGMCSLAERDVKEEEFFSQGVWESLSRSLLGVDKLRKRLSKVLLAQIAAELPSLIDEIEIKTKDCQSRLDKLGEPRANLEEQRLYLLHISQSFHYLIKASVDGTYNDQFFEDAESDSGYRKRIRAVVQNLNLDFAERISRRGHHREIVASPAEASVSRGVIPVTRKTFIDHIQHLMRRTKGRELPGTFNPMIVADLFLEQSASWESIARSHIEKVWTAARDFLRLVTDYVADSATSEALFQKIFEPALKKLLETLNAKCTELLKPHQKIHPITYNHSFTEALQRVRNERNKDEYSEIIRKFFGATLLDSVSFTAHHRDLRPLVSALLQRTEPDMNRFACSEALDCMEAYYKVASLFSLNITVLPCGHTLTNLLLIQIALKRFTDDVAIEVVETKLVSPLYDIFSPISVTSMENDLVKQIAGESEENRVQRDQLTGQLEVLVNGLETCKQFIGIRVLGGKFAYIAPF